MSTLCCRCGRREATLFSPSGNPSGYCADCGKAACGKHTIADFEYCEALRRFVCPCVAKAAPARQEKLWNDLVAR